MTTFKSALGGSILGAIIVAALIAANFATANGPFTMPNIVANKSEAVTVGPDTNVQILASTSRSYALITRDSVEAAVYCNANGDTQASTTAASFKLSTSTGETYEIHVEKNPYDGAVRCYASASTTLLVYELKRK